LNALAERVLGVAKEYLGPASQQFLSRELRALGCTADTITPAHVAPLAGRARASALRIMDEARATDFAEQLGALGLEDSAPIVAAPKSRAGKADQGPLVAAAALLAAGKLRQAEEAYRQLAARPGGVAVFQAYQGLARAAVALEDLPAALLALRDGAAALTRNGDRAGAIALLAEAVALAPGDLAAHRRLAAAHANAGDIVSACDEYGRFVDHALAEGDPRRALLELTYGRETLGDMPALLRVADRLMPAGLPAARAGAPAPAAPAPAAPVRPVMPPSSDVQRLVPAAPPVARRIDAAELPRTRPLSASSAVHLADARTMTHVEVYDEPPVDLLARTAPRRRSVPEPRPAVDLEALLATLQPSGSPEQVASVADVRATVLIGARDPRATEATLDAARRLLALHKLQAASDLLLDYIGAGYNDREAQRLLIEVDCGLGRRDVARDKCKLLGAAYRLDGRAEIAEDVERLAAIL
jgi:tetratricopeptide (TPR) repeat protein